jgi:hypothetical protein
MTEKPLQDLREEEQQIAPTWQSSHRISSVSSPLVSSISSTMKSSLLMATTIVSASASTLLHCTENCLLETQPYDSPRMYGVMEEKKIYWNREKEMGMIGISSSTGAASCVDGQAAGYPCSGIDLLSFTSLKDLGSNGAGNDIWGWTDDESNEYVIAGCSDGSSFVDVTDPIHPIVLGFLPTQTVASSWRDMKVYQGHVFIGSEAKDHGMQVGGRGVAVCMDDDGVS